MTRDEAITIMQVYKEELEHRIAKIDYDVGAIDLYSIQLDAFEVAIEALSAEAPKPTGELIARADAIEAVIAEGRKVYTSEYANAERVIYEADAVEALSLLPSADAVGHEVYDKRTQADERIIDSYRREFAEVVSAEAVHKPDYSYEANMVKRLRQAEAVQGWIPFKTRPLTDEEKQEYPDWTYIFDCPLPDDGEEILLSNGKYVWTDTFINEGECYHDGGDDIDDGMAWMHLPEPYEPKTERRG